VQNSTKGIEYELIKKIRRIKNRNFKPSSQLNVNKNMDKGRLKINLLLKKKAPNIKLVKEMTLTDDKVDNNDTVLIESQESPLNGMQIGSPRIPEKQEPDIQFKQQFIRKRSPFSEIVDKGISEYLGSYNNQYSISNTHYRHNM